MADFTALVSFNESGFWQAELFDGESDEPETFFTMSPDATAEQCAAKARAKWPLAKVEIVCAICDGDGELPVGDCDDGTCWTCDGTGRTS